MYENRWNWALSHVYEAVFWSVFPDGFLENFTEVWSMFETFLGQRICSYVGELESLGQGWKHKCPNKEFEEGQKQEDPEEDSKWCNDFWVSEVRCSTGAIHSTKIPTGPTGKSGPPQKVDQFFRNFSGWTEPIHWVLDRNFRKFWFNGSRPLFAVLSKGFFI